VSATPLEFWFEFASTYSYPAAARIEAVAAAAGVPVVWRPFLLGPIFRAQGWNDSPFNLYPAKGRYMWRDLARVCASLELPLRQPSTFPRNGLLAARVACRFADETWCPAFVRGVYRANFGEDRDIGDASVLASCLTAIGQPANERIAAANADKDLLRAQTERAVAIGIFGAPTFTVGDELFWGNDRLETALESWRVRYAAASEGAPA
jgi:2-hydroxychromene-2-carboxylate isomerase